MATKIKVNGPIVSNDSAWIYNYFGMDAACPNTIAKGLEEAAGDEVIIEINSIGGVCVYGYEMYTAIMAYEGKVTAHVISAMSAASLLVCAADEALISDTGIFMIHNARSKAQGDYRDLEMEADALKEFNAGIINAYVRKTGKPREAIQALMDKNSYMSPQTAIEQGFIDGYMFGDPNREEGNSEECVTNIVAAGMPIIPESKAKALRLLIAEAEERGKPTLAQQIEQETGKEAVSDKTQKEGGTKMTLDEFLAENPDAKAEINALTGAARAGGQKEERERMKSLDAISSTVTAEALNDAKYGEKPVDGPTLAYQAMVNGEKLAAAYMAAVKKDSEESGVGKVGIGTPDAGQEQTDEADEMAAYVNRGKEGK